MRNKMNEAILKGLTPGSKEAQAQGCVCPVIDNSYGKGWTVYGEQQFVVRLDCYLHGVDE